MVASVEGLNISGADVKRMMQATRHRTPREAVLPRLPGPDTQVSEASATISVGFVKKAGEGTPIRFMGAGNPSEATGIRLSQTMLSA